MWELVALLGVILLFLFYLYRSRNVSYWEKKGVVTASGGNWFFGHFKPVIFCQKHTGTLYEEVCRENPDAAFIGMYKLDTPTLVVREPDVIKAVLSTDFPSFMNNDMQVDKDVDLLIGVNPFTQSGENWKVARSHVTPSLTFAKLKLYFPTIKAVGNELVKYVAKKVEGGPVEFEAKELAATFTIDVVANAVCGIENNTFENSQSFMAQLTNELFNSVFVENIKMAVYMLFPEFFGKRMRLTPKHSEKVLVGMTKKMMASKAKSDDNHSDLFQHFLKIRERDTTGVFTDEYIAGHVFGFIMDGFETSSIVICYTIFELAWSEEVQEKLRTEVKDLISRTNGEYTIDDVEGLQYLDMVISEALRFLRLHPPLPVMTKQCTLPYTIPPSSNLKQPLTLTPGDFVAIPVMNLHMNPEHYPEPDRFHPERFQPDTVAERHKFVYLPFGEGPRKCLGMRFGLLQTKVALINLISNFRLKPSSKSNYNVQPDPKVMMITRPLGGAWVTIERL